MPSHQYSLFFHREQTMVVMDGGLGHELSMLGVWDGERRKTLGGNYVSAHSLFTASVGQRKTRGTFRFLQMPHPVEGYALWGGRGGDNSQVL